MARDAVGRRGEMRVEDRAELLPLVAVGRLAESWSLSIVIFPVAVSAPVIASAPFRS
jgi:hypothetical protein